MSRPSFTDEEALAFHAGDKPGKLEINPTKPMATQRDLSLDYSPGVAVPVLAIAGSLAAKKTLAQGPGTLPTHGPLFVGLLVGTVLLIGALTYVPALALGPAVEHLMLWAGW